jgi:hypothetical protein
MEHSGHVQTLMNFPVTWDRPRSMWNTKKFCLAAKNKNTPFFPCARTTTTTTRLVVEAPPPHSPLLSYETMKQFRVLYPEMSHYLIDLFIGR